MKDYREMADELNELMSEMVAFASDQSAEDFIDLCKQNFGTSGLVGEIIEDELFRRLRRLEELSP